LHVLPLNGGHAEFVDAPGTARDLLSDCGNQNAVALVTLPFLHAQGINQLGNFVLTHGDLQQMGGAENIVTNFSPQKIFANPVRARSSAYRNLVADLEKLPSFQTVAAAENLSGWKVLHPDRGNKFSRADDNALVLLGEIRGTSVLLLSDLGRTGQKALMERYPDLHPEIVVGGLPAQDEPLCDSLLVELKPKLIIITDSEYPATRRASPKLRARLAKTSAQILYCRDTGALTFHFRNGRWDLANAQGTILTASTAKMP
jgi:competence protein ComEC